MPSFVVSKYYSAMVVSVYFLLYILGIVVLFEKCLCQKLHFCDKKEESSEMYYVIK